MTIRSVPLDSQTELKHRQLLAQAINELIKFNNVESNSWTPVVRGSGTAGTYEISTNACRYTRIGRRIFLDIDITFAGAVTGGGTGYMQIVNLPFARSSTAAIPVGAVVLAGVAFTGAGVSPVLHFTGSSTLYIYENATGGGTNLQVSGVGANDVVRASISYETDDV